MNNGSSSGGNMPIFTGGSYPNTIISVPAQPVREVDSAMNGLSAEMEELARTVKEVYERLQSVLAPRNQACSTPETMPPARFGCVLATAIDNQVGYLRTNREKLQEILAALQL